MFHPPCVNEVGHGIIVGEQISSMLSTSIYYVHIEMGEAVLFDQHLMSIPILLRIQPSIPHKMLTLRLFVPKVHVHQTGKFLEILINKVTGFD